MHQNDILIPLNTDDMSTYFCFLELHSHNGNGNISLRDSEASPGKSRPR